MSDNKQYFAAREAKDTASIVLEKANSWFGAMQSNSYLDKLEAMYKAYYGVNGESGTGHKINFTGEQGELVSLDVNHFRNLAQHIFVMITSNRPVMEARAVNTDYKSEAQTYLANGILDYYMREKHLEDCLKKAAETAIVLGAGFIKLEWNATAGETYDIDDESNQPIKEGEIEFSNLSPLDVVVDGTKENWNHDWVLTRSFQNRFNLIAKYPELEDKIRSIPSKSDNTAYRSSLFTNDDTDDIPVYEFYHKRTEALPDGRYILFSSPETIFLEANLPYRVVPIFRIAPSDIIGTPYGYSPMFDILPIQEAINSLYSTILTNQNAFGVQNLFVQRGADIAVNQLEGGLNIIEGNSKPEPLNLTETPAEVFKFLEMLIQSAETISGVNSVARGNPEASLKSGTALALVQSMALQFISGLQQSYVKMIEDVGTSLISILKDFATTPKVIALVGKNNRSLLKEFTGEQISSINRVVVDVGNPLSRTISGRVQMAEQMLQMKLLKSPEQYFQVLNTGRLDSVFEGEMAELLLIKSENERMLDGENPLTSPLDAHRLHINEHKSVIADPELRKDPALVKNVIDHIQGHLDALRNTDPDLLALVGQQPLAPAGMPPNPQDGSGAPQPTQQAIQESPAGEMLNASPQNETINGPGLENAPMPRMPTPPAPFEQLPVTADQLLPQ